MPAETKPRAPSKHRERTEATRAKLMAAALDVFTRDGYADARLEQIALEAGYTRGAIYAHYKSKEDLFLALFEQRAQLRIAEFREAIERLKTPEERLKHVHAMLVQKSCDESWALLVLEFKLYALRQPKLKARLQRLIEMTHATSHGDGLSLLFGALKPGEALRAKRRMALAGAILTAAVLESRFRPDLLSGKNLHRALRDILEAAIRV